MTYQLLLFGPWARQIGQSQITITAPSSEAISVSDFTVLLAQQYPLFKSLLTQARIAINHTYATTDQIIFPSDELALIGMVSGG